MITNTPDFHTTVKQRLEQGDFQPLLSTLMYRQSAAHFLRHQGRDPALLEGIPDQLSHPVIESFMADNHWDVATIPDDEIQQLADRTRERINEVLTAPPRPAQ